MRERFDRRVLPEGALALVRACQRRVSAQVAGGAALSGAWLAHRLSRDVDLVCHRGEDVRSLVRGLRGRIAVGRRAGSPRRDSLVLAPGSSR